MDLLQHSAKASKCLIFFALFIFLSSIVLGNANGSNTEETGHSLSRRSYDSPPRHKGKENAAAKIPAAGGKPANVFATDNCTVVVAQIGGTATLPCVVRKFNTGVVSWIRKHDYHLLTVGLTTYSADDRFMVEHVRHLQNWGLLIKHVQFSDAGLYECQVSTHPPTSIFLELKVTEASAEILGAPDLHLRAGSSLRLVCTLRQSTEPPSYVFWYHEQRMINYDQGVQVIADRSSSILLLQDADKTHNGNYTCSPSKAIPASINVHVLNATAGFTTSAI
ncbi:hemicentin-2-like [Atheta coriaria]|uniref:hemicentin-2-like n=1 Tax=Dalotia coriaria TaxID=877792 RepID=UPI0031F357E4